MYRPMNSVVPVNPSNLFIPEDYSLSQDGSSSSSLGSSEQRNLKLNENLWEKFSSLIEPSHRSLKHLGRYISTTLPLTYVRLTLPDQG